MERLDSTFMILLFAIMTVFAALQIGAAILDYKSGKPSRSGDSIVRFIVAGFFGTILVWVVVAGPEPRWLYASLPAVITLKWIVLGVIGLLQRRRSLERNDRI